MPNLENLRKQAKLVYAGIATATTRSRADRAVLPRYRHLSDSQILDIPSS